MNAERLLQHFDRISEAPDAIPHLRRFILDLAVRGQLVPQDPNDEPAAELLKRVEEEKMRLVKQGTIKRELPVVPIKVDELHSGVPDSWKWARLSDLLLGDSQNGYSKKPDDALNGVPILRISAGTVRKDGIVAEEEHKLIGGISVSQEKQYQLQPGDLLACRFNGNRSFVGRLSLYTGYLGIKPIYPDKLIRLRLLSQFVLPKLVMHFAESNDVRTDIESYCATTVGNWGISASNLKEVKIPLPPLAEQHRIVAKVDELMALCDQLEAAKTQREQSRDRLVAASLHRLNPPADAEEAKMSEAFRDHARFIFDLLPRLTTRPEHIKQLRETILNLAVRGQLVPQDPNDEPAAELLKRMVQSKQQNGTQSRKGATLQPLNDGNGELPFQIPSNWLWLRIGALFEVAGGIQKTPSRAPRSNAFPYLGVGNVYRGRIDLTTVKEFELQDGELERWQLKVGDLLIIEGNGSLSEIGRCAVWNGEIECCVHQNHVIRCRPLDPQISPFVLQFLNSPAGTAIMQRLAITSSGLYSLSVGKIRQIEAPLPPLAEQHRIVAKVDELMALCDQLEAQLTTTKADSRRLLEAVLQEALAPALEETA